MILDMKNSIKQFVEQQVVKVIPPQQRDKFILIATYCDMLGNAVFSLSAQEISLEFFQRFTKETNSIKLQDIEVFLDHDLIINFFTKSLLKSKNVELRKMIAEVDKKGLDQKSIKALDTLISFLQDVESNGGITYISYYTPTRYSQEDSYAIIDKIATKE